MEHKQWLRKVDGSPVAVLMIHGIAGTPAHFRDLLPVIPQQWTLYNILLDGHSKTVEDFSRTSMQKWKQQVAQTVEQLLASHERVILIAHSMGTLFALRAAIRYPDRIPFLFLLNVPTRPWVRFSTVQTCLRVSRGNLREDDHAAWAMFNDTGIRLTPQLWKYIGWTPRLMELLAEIRQVRRLLPQLRVPTYAFQSETDELVSARSCKDLEGHPSIKTVLFKDSGHFCYADTDTALLQKTLQGLLEEVSALIP